MQTQTKKTLTIDEIFDLIQMIGIDKARRTFAPDTKVTANGKISKTTTKENDLIAVIESEMKIFASMANTDLVAFNPKFKKGARVKIEGVLQSLGFDAICLSQCRIVGN